MCENVKQLTFCSCMPDVNTKVIHNKNNRKNKIKKDVFIWELKRKIEDKITYNATDTEDSNLVIAIIEGMLMMPSDSLVGGLNANFVLNELNTRSCFDFDYIPNEGDNLVLHNPKKYVDAFISFIFNNKKWELGMYDGFKDKLEVFNHGKLK